MAKKQLVSTWLKQADEDYLWAEASFREEVWRGTCFAVQQAAEKYLKTYIIAKDLNFEKIHDLKRLVQICQKEDSNFKELSEYAENLNSFYIEMRYPGFMIEITRKEAEKALKEVTHIAEFVKSKII